MRNRIISRLMMIGVLGAAATVTAQDPSETSADEVVKRLLREAGTGSVVEEPVTPTTAAQPLADITKTGDSPKTIAIIKDGPSEVFSDSLALVKDELRSMASSRFQVRFKESPAFNAQWNPAKVPEVLQAALIDSEVDIIIAYGVLTSLQAGRPEVELAKPVVSAILQKGRILGLPVTEEGRSAKKNFALMIEPRGVEADLRTFREMAGLDHVHIIADATITEQIAGLDEQIALLRRNLGLKITLLDFESVTSMLSTLSAIRPQGVYLAPLPRISQVERNNLIKGINQRRIPSFSVVGLEDVENGALAAQSPRTELRVARRVTANVMAALQGGDLTQLSVYAPIQQRLVMNGKTAALIGFDTPMGILLTAEIINREALEKGDPLTLQDAMRLAEQNNSAVAIQRANLASASGFRDLARSALLPQASANTSYTHIDPNTANPLVPAWRWTTSVTVSQIIYSDDVYTDFRNAKKVAFSEAFEEQSAKLDAMATAGVQFLNILVTQALTRIDIENLRLNQTNLELAKLRLDVGTAGPEQSFRFESEVANARATLLGRESDLLTTMTALNQTLGVRGMKRIKPQDIQLPDGNTYFLDNRLSEILTTEKHLEALRIYAVHIALRNSPELLSLDELIAGQGFVLAKEKRSFFVPQVTGRFNYEREVDRDNDVISPSVENAWNGVVTAELPLFEGGGRFARINQAKADLDALLLTRVQSAQIIEQSALNAVYALESSFPTIQLTRQAAEAARKNLQVIQERYTEGETGVTELLDAQNTAIVAEQNAVVAVYSYLIDLIDFQRAIAWFEYQQPRASRDAWVAGLHDYVRRKLDGEKLDVVETRERIRMALPVTYHKKGEGIKDSTPPPEKTSSQFGPKPE